MPTDFRLPQITRKVFTKLFKTVQKAFTREHFYRPFWHSMAYGSKENPHLNKEKRGFSRFYKYAQHLRREH